MIRRMIGFKTGDPCHLRGFIVTYKGGLLSLRPDLEIATVGFAL